MGLIARALEAAGIVTTGVSAARDITVAARMPRSVFVDFPHGHTTGKVGDAALTAEIVAAALALTASDEPEQLIDLPYRWSDTDEWKDDVFLPRRDSGGGEAEMVDDRTPRHESPQYQLDTDADAAAATHADQECLVCAGLDY